MSSRRSLGVGAKTAAETATQRNPLLTLRREDERARHVTPRVYEAVSTRYLCCSCSILFFPSQYAKPPICGAASWIVLFSDPSCIILLIASFGWADIARFRNRLRSPRSDAYRLPAMKWSVFLRSVSRNVISDASTAANTEATMARSGRSCSADTPDNAAAIADGMPSP